MGSFVVVGAVVVVEAIVVGVWSLSCDCGRGVVVGAVATLVVVAVVGMTNRVDTGASGIEDTLVLVEADVVVVTVVVVLSSVAVALRGCLVRATVSQPTSSATVRAYVIMAEVLGGIICRHAPTSTVSES